jgi:hypothetical protein
MVCNCLIGGIVFDRLGRKQSSIIFFIQSRLYQRGKKHDISLIGYYYRCLNSKLDTCTTNYNKRKFILFESTQTYSYDFLKYLIYIKLLEWNVQV